MSDEKKDEWSLLTPENLDVYHTRSFEDAQNIVGEEADFKELNPFGSDESDDFAPIIEGQDSDDIPDGSDIDSTAHGEEIESSEQKPKDGEKDSKLDAVSIIVEEEKKVAYEKGFEEGRLKGLEEAKANFESENLDLREETKAQGFEEGKSSGYEAGFQEGREAGEKEIGLRLEEFSEFLDSVNSSWNSVKEKYEDVIVELSINIAKKVLYSNLTLDADFVKLAIKEALNEIPDPVEVTIGVNPDDYNIIEMIKEDFFQRFEDLKNITIIADPTIGRGGCRIDSESGGITQTVENRLRYLEDQLLKKGMNKNI